MPTIDFLLLASFLIGPLLSGLIASCTKIDNSFHHHLSKRELHHVFGVEQKIDVPEYDVFYPKFDRKTTSGNQRLQFRAFDQNYEFLLRPQTDKLISNDVISIVRDGKNSRMTAGTLGKSSRCHFVGELVSHGNASVALSNCNSLRGSVILPDKFLLLNPIPQRIYMNWTYSAQDVLASPRPHVIFKRSAGLYPPGFDNIKWSRNGPYREFNRDFNNDGANLNFVGNEENIKFVEQEFTEFCDVKFEYTVPQIAKKDSLYIFPNMDPMTLELALFLDSQLWKHFLEEFGEARAEEELTDFSLALINNVYVLYQQPSIQPKLDIVLVRHELWKSQPVDLISIRHKSGQAQLLLDAFCSYQLRQNPGNDATPGHWDHAVLLTGYDIYHTTSSVAGVAPVARMCDEKFTCALVEGLHLGRSFVLAHEMGHNLGMVHDGVQNLCEKSCCLMSAVNGAGKTTWSACSVREYNAYIQSLSHAHTPPNCMIDGHNSDGQAAVDHKLDRSQKPQRPGQRYTADQQCAFFWGRDFRHEVPAGRSRSEICDILWCGNGGSTISTAHPALDGTWCGGSNWCISGVCVPWEGEEPPSVNGAWSAWTQLPTATCSECKVTDGLRVRKEHRICDNPAPNNGGMDCIGSESRGIVCLNKAQSCTGFTTQSYGDSLCSAFKNDRYKPDRQLSGKSFLHPSSTCKVWCHLAGSDLIRNKAQFPDGTPCESGYCVNGICMILSCSLQALILNPQDCPSEVKQPPHKKVERTLGWTSWADWTDCSSTCGQATRSRTRDCQAPIGGNCLGEKEQTEDCTMDKCPEWSSWSEWSPCSATCGDDLRVTERFSMRTCSTIVGCPGEAIKHEDCNLPKCPNWVSWGPWSDCSDTCGTGSKSRKRGCTNGLKCVGADTEIQECNEKACAEWTSWSEWNECSVSCGKGERKRSRDCLGENCEGPDSQIETCPKKKACPEWTPWSIWGECSKTCGSGQRLRKRDCLPEGFGCSGIDSQSEKCNLKECSEWGFWAEWSECSVSCGPGMRTRTRTCIGPDCVGQSQQIKGCNKPECSKWSNWSSWSDCSKSCGSGEQRRTRTCSPNKNDCMGENSESLSCGQEECPIPTWTAWSEWDECSKSCGQGTKTRTRECPESGCSGASSETTSCNKEDCTGVVVAASWAHWDEWGECSKSCGYGTQTRTRSCPGSPSTVLIVETGPTIVAGNSACVGNGQELKTCFTKCRDGGSQWGSWTEWSVWSDCTVSCGLGFQQRDRDCLGPHVCIGNSKQTMTCQTRSCSQSTVGQYLHWEEWSKCSQACGGGLRQRIRHCNGDCGAAGLVDTLQVRTCNNEACNNYIGDWGLWSEWSFCNLSCGGGTKSRSRECIDSTECRGVSGETIECNSQPCKSNLIQPFKIRPGSEETPEIAKRIVGGSNFLVKHPEWSDWTSWSGCSCFNEKRVRRRYCQVFQPHILGYCIGPIHQEESCQPDSCKPVSGDWSVWSAWSICSKSCGANGTSIRNRICADPFPINRGPYCKGTSFERKDCKVDNICAGKPVDGGWSKWVKWSECSVSCGRGHRSRTRYCTEPSPSNGGRGCDGSDFNLEECRPSDNCQSVDGIWGGWSSWSQCGQTCGFAFQTRGRHCNDPAPSLGGRPCRGLSYMTKVCTLDKCPNAIDGGWSTWGSWSDCSPNCDYGVQSRTRSCTDPSSENGGYPCLGAATYVRTCTNHKEGCSSLLKNQKKTNTLVRDWEMHWT